MFTKARDLIIVTSLLAVVGCSGMCSKSRTEFSPEEVVQAYLDLSLNMKSLDEKAAIINLTTGNLREALEQSSDDVFVDAFIKKNYKLQSYSIVERRDRTPRETEITFLLSYKNLGDEREVKEEEAAEIKTENTVSVVKKQGAWAIRDVLGKKTTIDFPISKPTEIGPEKVEGQGEFN